MTRNLGNLFENAHFVWPHKPWHHPLALNLEITVTLNQIVCGPSILWSHIHGLIVVGGRGDDDEEVKTVQRLVEGDNALLSWQSLPDMFVPRFCPSVCLWKDQKSSRYEESELLIVGGGWNGKEGALRSCSLYDFHSSEWNEISEMNVARSCATLIHWKFRNKSVVVGGEEERASRSVEEYDLIKDQWLKLPDLKHPHRKWPSVWIDNSVLYGSYGGILCVAGDNVGGGADQKNHSELGTVEIFDGRDSAQKWQSVARLNSFFQSDVYKNKVFRRMVCC